MKTLQVTTTDPYFNLALEEYLLKEKGIEEDVFFVWRNTPCVVIGRNQNPFNEINLMYAKKHHIPVLRRISGGGTVYHDLGNINFTYLSKTLKDRLNNYRFFVQPIIDILNKMGVQARFVETSHIYIGDQKISGNAQSFYKDRMMHHGTLLFDGDLTHLRQLLKPKRRYSSHAVDSTRSDTTNIKNHLLVHTDAEQFLTFLLDEMRLNDASQDLVLSEVEIERIRQIAVEKYKTVRWTYGETPGFWINETWEGEVIQMRIDKGVITESSLEPDVLEGQWFLPDVVKQSLSHRNDVSDILRILFQ